MAVDELQNPEELMPLVHSALRAWYSNVGTNDDLLDGLLLVQQERRAMSNTSNPTALRLATNRILLAGIDELEKGDPRASDILKMRFADDNTLMMVANKINVSEYSVSRLQRSAIERLASILFEREQEARQTLARELEAQLPPPSYSKLFGITDALDQLFERLSVEDGPGVVAIVGIGGIGKTALADVVTRRLIRNLQFEKVAWLRSDPQTLSGRIRSPKKTFDNLIIELASNLGIEEAIGNEEKRLSRIRQVLKKRPHLVIVDNLETDADTAYILDELNDLSDPSRFILTTRTRHISQAALYHFELNELSIGDASSLVMRHAEDLGLSNSSQIDEESIGEIYALTGGNPLALKLIVSLLDLLPLEQILTDLQISRLRPIEDLYKHIYWQAWRILSQDARILVQAMPLVGESGGLPDYLQTISELSAERFWPALHELRSRSLVEIRGTIHLKRYGVHRLTESFLRTEIIHWPEE